MIADAVRLTVYFGDSLMHGHELASDVLVRRFAEHRVAVAALYRGMEGFGLNRRIHAVRLPGLSADLPLVGVAVDTRERIEALVPDVDRAVSRGLLTLERTRLATDGDAAGAEFPPGPGSAARLTVYCGRGERAAGTLAYRAVVEALRRSGAAGATVLLGVDGVHRGRRRRARLFGSCSGVPLAVVSVGPAEILQRSLPHVCGLLEQPVVTLEGTALVKHDGRHLDELPAAEGDGGADIWQTISVYARETSLVHGRSLYTELTRRLREAGASGATTMRCEWGFSSDERPHGDRFGRLVSHAPTLTVYVDRPAQVAEVWPAVDELTAEHGIVTSLLVPWYRERAEGAVREPGVRRS